VWLLLPLGLMLAAPPLPAAEAMTFKLGTWVCQTPETYDEVTRAANSGSQSNQQLRQAYKDNCLFMDDDNIEDMLPPFVTILDNENDKAKVTFFVEFYRKLAVLEANIKHVRFVGWTAKSNVETR